ncbi:MAG: hypothetical protein ABI446_10815 [Gemmatimonadaceae bacterium]
MADEHSLPFLAMTAGEWMNTSSASVISCCSSALIGCSTGENEYSSLMWYMLMSCFTSGNTSAYRGLQILSSTRVQPLASRIDRACFSLF